VGECLEIDPEHLRPSGASAVGITASANRFRCAWGPVPEIGGWAARISGCPFPVPSNDRRPYSTEMEVPHETSSPRAPGSARSVVRIAALSLMLLAVAFGVTIASLRVIEIAMGRPHPPGDYWLFNTLVAIAFSVSGAAIALRRPRNPIGWAFIAGALGNGVAGIGGEYTALTGDPIGVWLLSWAWMPLPLAIAVTLHTFPTGQAWTPRWQPVLIAAALAGVAGIIVQATSSSVAGAPPTFRGPPVAIGWPAWVYYAGQSG